MRRCAECGEAYDFTYSYCPRCGAPNPEAGLQRSPSWSRMLLGLLLALVGVPFAFLGACTLLLIPDPISRLSLGSLACPLACFTVAGLCLWLAIRT